MPIYSFSLHLTPVVYVTQCYCHRPLLFITHFSPTTPLKIAISVLSVLSAILQIITLISRFKMENREDVDSGMQSHVKNTVFMLEDRGKGKVKVDDEKSGAGDTAAVDETGLIEEEGNGMQAAVSLPSPADKERSTVSTEQQMSSSSVSMPKELFENLDNVAIISAENREDVVDGGMQSHDGGIQSHVKDTVSMLEDSGKGKVRVDDEKSGAGDTAAVDETGLIEEGGNGMRAALSLPSPADKKTSTVSTEQQMSSSSVPMPKEFEILEHVAIMSAENREDVDGGMQSHDGGMESHHDSGMQSHVKKAVFMLEYRGKGKVKVDGEKSGIGDTSAVDETGLIEEGGNGMRAAVSPPSLADKERSTVSTEQQMSSSSVPMPKELFEILEHVAIMSAEKAACTVMQYLRDNSCSSDPDIAKMMEFLLPSTSTQRACASAMECMQKDELEDDDDRSVAGSVCSVSSCSSSYEGLSYTNTRFFNSKWKLRDAFTQLTRLGGHWAYFEEESIILDHLSDLNDCVLDVDLQSLKAFLKANNYKCVENLLKYFTHDRRWSIRTELFAILDTLASRDSTSYKLILESSFPVELAREIGNPMEKSSEKLTCYSLLLAQVLSGGLELPDDHYDIINTRFVTTLLKKIETDLGKRKRKKDMDAYMKVILAFNLHFAPENLCTNHVLAALMDPKMDFSNFKDSLMYYILNREDPLRVFVHELMPISPHAGLKMLLDILRFHNTNCILDEIEMDIILKAVVDNIPFYKPGDPKRTMSLNVVRLITRLIGNRRKITRVLLNNLNIISKETSSDSAEDRKIIRRIYKELDAYQRDTQF